MNISLFNFQSISFQLQTNVAYIDFNSMKIEKMAYPLLVRANIPNH